MSARSTSKITERTVEEFEDKAEPPLSRGHGESLIRTPGAVVRDRPLRFAGMMLVVGFAGGTLLRSRLLRKAARAYAKIRRY